ncbi:glutathione S-transferase family protein [Neisseriaceae bacterium TC5R-5]|nr:glutathione S-transferase family protein [Neisseriaceae bacterium TC5R-5]
MFSLFIGNKNYSSWSLRPWVAMRHFGVPFSEQKVRFDSFTPDSSFKQRMNALHSAGTVPALQHGELVIGDSLAIVEYLAELYPEQAWWPREAQARAVARNLCARMHSGFNHLRRFFPMNVEADLPKEGALIWRDQASVRADVLALTQEWENCLQRSGGPLLFGDFSIADAFFAPVCLRFKTYHVPISARAQAYVDHVLALPAVKEWVQAAKAEQDFRDFEEPYRLQGSE